MAIIGSSKLQMAGYNCIRCIVDEEFKTDFVTVLFYSIAVPRFGDTRDDTHEFTGSISLSGSNVSFLGDSSVGIGTSSPVKAEIKDTSSNVGIRLTTGMVRRH